MIITFVGHGDLFYSLETEKRLKEILREFLERDTQAEFYCGGYGNFDHLCAKTCHSLKMEGYECKIFFVTPYINEEYKENIKCIMDNGYYDASIYPPIEKTPLRYAISKRNEWMVREADLVIAYVRFICGGAFKTLEYAKRRKKIIINLFDSTDLDTSAEI